MSEQIAGIVNNKCIVVEPDDFEAFVNELFANRFGGRIIFAMSADCVHLNKELLEKLKAINADIVIHSSAPLSGREFLSIDHEIAVSPKDKPKPFWANDWRKKHKR